MINKKEAKLIINDALCSLNSIMYFGKPDMTINSFHKYNIKDFDLKEADMTKSEFNSYISILGKMKVVAFK